MNRRQFLSMAVAAVMLLAVVPAVVPFFGFVSASQIQLSGKAIAWDVVNLTWTPYQGAKAYEIYRSTDPTNVISPNNLLVVVNWSSYPQYEPGKTYLQGDVVEYDGKLWRAKYWTQNTPGGDAWELIGNATPATHYLDQYNLTANTTYFYAVVPVLEDGSKGTPSGILQITTPYEPYRIIVYYISWARYARQFYVSDIPWENITQVNYAFLDLKPNGTVTFYDTYADPLNLEALKEYKEKYPAVKVLVSVGGWTLSKYFSPVAADPEKRLEFAKSVLGIIRKYDLDGVDIDWEYPGGGGLSTNYVSPDDGKNFVLLLKTIREVFNQAEKEDHKDYLITVAAPADPVKAERVNWTAVSKYVDSINIMTYDYHGAWDNITGHNAPLYCDPNAPYQDENVRLHFCVNYSVQWYIKHVPDRTKLTLGLPFYGRSFANVPPTNNGLYQNFSGTPDGTWGPASETHGVMDYWDIAEKIASGEYKRYWDPIAMVPYAYSPTQKVFISYDDPESIGIKVDYALKNGIGGVMVWEITADRKPGTNSHPLLDAILEHLKERPPAWVPDTYYIGSSVPANLTVPEPSYNETTPSTENSSTNQTPSNNQTLSDNQTSTTPENGSNITNQTGTVPEVNNQTPTNGSVTSNQTSQGGESNYPGGNETETGNTTLYRPGTISVKHTSWGTGGEYDVTLNLGGTYDWELYVRLEGATLASYWSADKSTNGTWIVFTPKSWNRGPTASLGFTYQGSVENVTMALVVNGQLWDVWPENTTAVAPSNPAVNSTTANESASNGTVQEPSNQTGIPGNTTGNESTSLPTNQSNTTTSNQTALDNQTGGETGANQTSTSPGLVKPDAFSVKVTDWGSTEYDVTLNLGGTYDWVVKVRLKDGSTVSSSWSVNKAEENGYVVFTPLSWNKGPTASFGFIATGSKPVEAMYLYVNGQLWDVWPENVVPGNQTLSDNQTNTTPENGSNTTNQTGTTPGSDNSTNTTPGNETYIPAGPGLPEHFFAPYIDMTLTDVHKPLVEYYNLTGTPYFTLAFILYGSAFNGPSWGGKLPLDYYNYTGEVMDLRKAGGDVIISFGGAVGPYLCQQAQSAEQLANWYLQVIDTYNVTYIDFDIESSINVSLLADALLIVQRERPDVKVSFTLPSDPGAGLVGNGYSIIQTMVQKGLRLTG